MALHLGSSQITTKSTDTAGGVSYPLVLDGSSAEKAAPSAMYLKNKAGITTDGVYYLNPGGLGAAVFYINFTYDSARPWVMVIANRTGTGAVGSLTYANATNPIITTNGTYNSDLNFNLWVGLDYWPYLGNTVLQYVASSVQDLDGTHTKRARWKFSGWSSTYAFVYPRDLSIDTGTSPGLYAYHATNGYSLSTYDNDQDVHGGNCSAAYGNNPWWYGACWDGSYFGHNQSNSVHWSGSSADAHNYGAIFLASTDL